MAYTLRVPDDLDALVALIAACQQDPAQRCLHCDQTPAGLRAEILALDPPWQAAFLGVYSGADSGADSGSELLAVLGCDCDFEMGRGWLHGPFAQDKDWQNLFQQLFDGWEQRLPATITRLSNYLDQANQRGLDFHLQRGFQAKGLFYVVEAKAQPIQRPASVRPFLPSDAEMLCQLHTLAFPAAWLSGPAMITQRDETHAVLIAWEQGQRVGYIRLSQHLELPEGEIEYLAVDPAWRGRGIGRKLLLAGLDWIFAERGLPTAVLNVSADNAKALELYLSVGFEVKERAIALDLWRKNDDSP